MSEEREKPAGAHSNWGRWGPDDERGAANFVTPAHLVAAAGLVRRGRAYSLAFPLNGEPINPRRGAPTHLMAKDAGDYALDPPEPGRMCGAEDYIAFKTHSGTHIDALSHAWYDGQLFNGFPASSTTSAGAGRLGIEKLGSLVTRGVLLDVARHLGVPHLPAGHAITPEELDGAASAQKVAVGEGDALLVRTGWPTTYDEKRPLDFWTRSPGLGLRAFDWVEEKRLAAVGADNYAIEVDPSETGYKGPGHMRLIRDLGCYFIEMLSLEDLARDGVHEFLFVVAPLKIVGGTASPINPLAIC